jgi:hypothetical protein
MTIDAPQLTQVINLLIAIGVFSSIVFGFILKLRSWQNKDVDLSVARRISPVVVKQSEMAEQQTAFEAKVDLNHKTLDDKFDRLNSAVLGHESRLSFVEGKEAGRIEGWSQAQRGMPLKQIPQEEEL